MKEVWYLLKKMVANTTKRKNSLIPSDKCKISLRKVASKGSGVAVSRLQVAQGKDLLQEENEPNKSDKFGF